MALAMFEEEPEQEVGGAADTSEDEAIEKSDHDTINGEKLSEGDEEQPKSINEVPNEEYFVAKDKKTLWSRKPIVSTSSKMCNKNIVKIFPGPKARARNITDEKTAFEYFFTNDIINNIVSCTNLEIDKNRPNYERSRDANNTTKSEILALIGLLFLTGLRKQNHSNFLELWANDGTGSEIFRACMNCNRFLFLLKTLRFDDINTRIDRKKTDNLAAFRFTLNRFVENCKKNYCLSSQVTIDEMLIPFSGKCNFIQYSPNKSAKCGLKAFVLCDAKTFYVSNMEIYCGEQPEGPYKKSNSAADIAHRLLQPWKGKNTNLTCDNRYTSYSLAKDLLKDKITLVGTLKKNISELPSEFLSNKNRLLGSSIFGFQKEITIVSYVPKNNQPLVLLSTMHDNPAIDPDTNMPDIILDYNAHKGVVDTVDKMCSCYSVSRRSRRWPLVLFFQLLNIAGINSQILYNANQLELENTHKYRKTFLKTLSMSLMKAHLTERAQLKTLPANIQLFLSKYKNQQQQVKEENECHAPPPAKIRGRCLFCARHKNRVTTISCHKCNKSVCKEHAITVCSGCENRENRGDAIEMVEC